MTTLLPQAIPLPWFHEHGYGQLWNEWTWTHIAWGILSYQVTKGYVVGFLAHTLYEIVEGRLFPTANRDVSITNHIGDTVAFLAGSRLGQYIEIGK